ncbi:TadE/TadG family type IV pilus assembly protein [Paenibacillus agricola]|uniref:Pilus assembly protein n=1 Tax=Paenibacillus agricola TaxID=2716264 RepID=A0ABX0J303_9BACL|nr:TadE family protein [Paenibacillus agricola]NHN30710.1 pilus assembly protein [Paenibacillus agricola]
MRLARREEGSIVLEAAIVLPLFLSFILLLVGFIQVSLAEMALQSAVSDTTKVIAANMYPLDLVYQEAKSRWEQTAAKGWMDQALEKIGTAKEKVVQAEEFVDEYERWIPEPVVMLMGWEKNQRAELEALSQAGTEEAKQQIKDFYQPRLNAALTPMVVLYANKTRLKPERLKVTRVILPDLNDKEQAFIGIEAQYELKLAIPFFNKSIQIRKHAYEHAWVGGS